MAFRLPSRVKETTITTGPGTYTLAGALSTAWRTFAVGGLTNGDMTFYYCESATDFEFGLGTWNTGGTLTRTEVLGSSNGGAAVSWAAGAKIIGVGQPGPEDLDSGAYQKIAFMHNAMGIRNFKNLLHNGGFQIAQRGAGPFTSVTVPANTHDSYLLDGCIFLSAGADICDVSRIGDWNFVSGYCLRLDVETSSRFGLLFPVEYAITNGIRASGRVSVQFKAKRVGASLANVRVYLLSWTGGADAILSSVMSAWGSAGGDPTFAANWTVENVAANSPVLTTTSLYRFENIAVDTANFQNIALFILSDPTAPTIGDFLDIGDVQIEEGPLATAYEHRPIGVDQALCQRYYYQFGGTASGQVPRLRQYMIAGGTFISNIFFPTSMRVAPSTAKLGTWAVSNANQPVISAVTVDGVNVSVAAIASNEAESYPNSVDDLLTFNAEL